MTVQFPHIDYLYLLHWVGSTSAKASILILFLLIVKFAFKSKIGARLHYLLWSVVIISLILPWTPQSPLSLYNFINPGIRQTSVVFQEVNNSPVADTTVNGISNEAKTDASVPVVFAQSQGSLPDRQKSIASLPFIHKLLFFIWLAGLVSFISVTLWVNRKFALRLQAQPVENLKLLSAFQGEKDKLNIKKEIPLVQTKQITSPSLYGLFHPRLLIPVSILEEFNPEQLSHVFCHELLHYKRKDLWVNWITRGLLTLHWFNPLIWYAFLRLREDQEMACDAVSIKHLGINGGENYAYTLIKLLEKNSNSSRIISLASLSGTQSQIGRRIAMIKFVRKTSVKWSVFIITVVAAIACVTLTNAKVSTSGGDEKEVPVTYAVSQNNLQTIKVEPNKLVSSEGWNLSINKVMNSGSTNGYGWHSPFEKTDTYRSYFVSFSIENAEGRDKAFLPKGKVLGIVGTSGKFYDFLDGQYPSLDKLYRDMHWEAIDDPNNPGHLDAMGQPNRPGLFKASIHATVDLDEQGVQNIVYQDEKGTIFEIPFQGDIALFWENVDMISKKVANLYGESNPKIAKVKPFPGESADLRGYMVFLEGNFSKDGKKASAIEFSMLADGTKVWALRGYNEDGEEDLWNEGQKTLNIAIIRNGNQVR